MEIVGIKELKDRLTYFVRRTKEGEKVIVTDRGAPVAILHSLDHIEEKAGPEEKLAALARRGLVTLPRRSLRKFAPVPSKGELASHIITEDRR
jgi:prevent-host-death family protein